MLQYFWFVWKKHGACVAFSYPSDEDFQFYSTYSMRTVEGHWFVQHRNIDWTGENIRVNIDLSPITWGAGVNVSRDRKLMDGWQSIRLAKYIEREDWDLRRNVCCVWRLPGYGAHVQHRRIVLCWSILFELLRIELAFWWILVFRSTQVYDKREKKTHTVKSVT